MGREVRRVTKDWEHPKRPLLHGERRGFKPLRDGYRKAVAEWTRLVAEEGLQRAVEYFGGAPDQREYMPDWIAEEATHFMMYETTSEGTPISPAFATPEELARWLADNGASAFGIMTATYEQWLITIGAGSAPSMVMTMHPGGGGTMESGVAAMPKTIIEPEPGEAFKSK